MFAARGGNPDMVKMLVAEHGASVNQASKVLLLINWCFNVSELLTQQQSIVFESL
jgi:hypothetical protein